MKGIILAGGAGTRLHPLTYCITKQLLPVYDKPMIYYPLSILMLGGIKDILLISDGKNIGHFKKLLFDGSNLGINISYEIQEKPNGIAESFIIGKEFIGNDSVTLILGDNIFHSSIVSNILYRYNSLHTGAVIFSYTVNDPSRYGVVYLNRAGSPINIIEKPKDSSSNLAIVGLYIYDNNVIDIANSLTPSNRGELEITDINKIYLKKKLLTVEKLGRGCTWLDAGTFSSLHSASSYIKTIQDRQGLKIGCVEEVAYRMGYISLRQLEDLAMDLRNSEYGRYLLKISKEEQDDI